MENKNNLQLKQFRGRFVSDFGLPISVVQDPYFIEYLNLYENEFGANTKHLATLDLIKEEFNNDFGKFLEYRNKVINDIVTYISNSEAYKEFNSDNNVLKNYRPIIGSRELYTQEQSGCFFISYDMIKANFQALRYANPSIVMDCDTYEDFVNKFTPYDYFKQAKRLRQEVFGKLNGKRTASLETRISNEFANKLQNRYLDVFELFSIKTDEIILKFKGDEKSFEKIKVENEEYDGIKFRVNKFKLTHQSFKRHDSDKLVTAFIKDSYLEPRRRTLHCLSSIYYPQVYKLLNGIKLNDSDTIFYFEHELCRFLNPLEIIHD